MIRSLSLIRIIAGYSVALWYAMLKPNHCKQYTS